MAALILATCLQTLLSSVHYEGEFVFLNDELEWFVYLHDCTCSYIWIPVFTELSVHNPKLSM